MGGGGESQNLVAVVVCRRVARWDESANITITGNAETENGIHMLGIVKWTQTETETATQRHRDGQ